MNSFKASFTQTKLLKSLFCAAFFTSLVWAQEAPLGSPQIPNSEEQKAINALVGQVKGQIVWSSSRSNTKHDIWIMKADGTEAKALTKGDQVDWFPRFSPDGQKVLFTRSKAGWVSENDAEFPEKWDLWTIEVATGQEIKVADNATWGTWRPDGETIAFSRGAQVFLKNLKTQVETLVLDGESALKKGVIVQEPNFSPDGRFIAATLRGSRRETGIWNIESKTWQMSGEGCQIDWFPSGDKLYRMNSTGNGGTAAPSEVLHFQFKNGQQVEKVGFFGIPENLKLMDLPGRRSHEYFPKLDQKGTWLVWGATDKGHDHDLYDYELYLWKLGTPKSTATRLTFHSGNDRWPDIYLEP